MRNCSRCDPTKLYLSVLEANPGLEENNNTIQWNRWIFVKISPAKAKKLVLKTFHGTQKELLDSFLEDLVSMSQHIFSANWNYAMFQYVRDNLKPGYLLQVLDFGQNYLNIFQDKPQSKHWDHSQTTIHLIVNFYLKEGESVVTLEECIMISDDKNSLSKESNVKRKTHPSTNPQNHTLTHRWGSLHRFQIFKQN